MLVFLCSSLAHSLAHSLTHSLTHSPDTTFKAFCFIASLTPATSSHSPTIPKLGLCAWFPKPALAVAVSLFCPKTCKLQLGILLSLSSPPASPIIRAVMLAPTRTQQLGAMVIILDSTKRINFERIAFIFSISSQAADTC